MCRSVIMNMIMITIRVHAHPSIHPHIFTYIHTHTYVHTYIHAYIPYMYTYIIIIVITSLIQSSVALDRQPYIALSKHSTLAYYIISCFCKLNKLIISSLNYNKVFWRTKKVSCINYCHP